MSRKSELTGMRFGRLTVLYRTEKTEDRYALWCCRCDCGNEILVNTKRLTRGTVKNCGCVPKTSGKNGTIAEDLTGKRFGDLTVLYRVENERGRTRWACRCDCGNIHIASARDLKGGKCKSCGCRMRFSGQGYIDITGQRFGRLTVLYSTDKRDKKGSVYWHCRCDCGNETDVTTDRLLHGNRKSCGCRKDEVQSDIHNKLHLVDGTCLEWLAYRKKRNDNTSGFRGVVPLENGKYRVNIGFKRKRFYVGMYNTFDEAVRARLNAEQLIHEGFLKAYEEWNGKAQEDPAWAKSHPLVFEVEKVNGTLNVRR